MCMQLCVMECPRLTPPVYCRVVPILEKVFLKRWHNVFQVKIPAAEKPIMPRITAIWEEYLEELVGLIQEAAPQLLPLVLESIPILGGIKDEIRDKVHGSLTKLSKCSAEIHPEFRGTMEEELAPMFESCLEITGTQELNPLKVPSRRKS